MSAAHSVVMLGCCTWGIYKGAFFKNVQCVLSSRGSRLGRAATGLQEFTRHECSVILGHSLAPYVSTFGSLWFRLNHPSFVWVVLYYTRGSYLNWQDTGRCSSLHGKQVDIRQQVWQVWSHLTAQVIWHQDEQWPCPDNISLANKFLFMRQ